MKWLLAIPFAVACRFLDALVLMWFWRWFAVPLGAPNVGYWQAMGLAMLAVWVVVLMHSPRDGDEDRNPAFLISAHVLAMLMAFGFGWLVHLAGGQ